MSHDDALERYEGAAMAARCLGRKIPDGLRPASTKPDDVERKVEERSAQGIGAIRDAALEQSRREGVEERSRSVDAFERQAGADAARRLMASRSAVRRNTL